MVESENGGSPHPTETVDSTGEHTIGSGAGGPAGGTSDSSTTQDTTQATIPVASDTSGQTSDPDSTPPEDTVTVAPAEPTDPEPTDPVYDRVTDKAKENTEAGIGSSPVDDGSGGRISTSGVSQCFWGSLQEGQKEEPIVKINHAISNGIVDVQVIFSPSFVDLTYGVNRIGWKRHTFDALVRSDHVEVALLNALNDTSFHGKIDLLSATAKAPSGYACLGLTGGDGALYKGSVEDIISFGSSFDDNINYHGYHLFASSPATDSVFSPNPDYPFWEFRAMYRVSVKEEIFGPSGFGSVHMTSVHASPSKNGIETVTVVEKTCPEPLTPGDPFTPTIVYDPTKWID